MSPIRAKHFSVPTFPRKVLWLTAATCAAAICGTVHAQAHGADGPGVSGFVSVELGEVVKGLNRGSPVDHWWTERLAANVALDRPMGKASHAYCAVESECWFPFERTPASYFNRSQQTYFRFYFDRAEGVVDFAHKRSRLEFGAGYFPFKYNPDARNLGEYLFRCDPYPQFVKTEFDYPLTRLLGLRVSGILFDRIEQHLLLTSATDHFPLYDGAVSYVVTARLSQALELGAGVSFDHLLPVDNSLTSGYRQDFDVGGETITHDYSFRGTKLMGRACFDAKPLLHTDFFRHDDLRLYAEACVLGVENYPIYYDTLWQRIPVMVGLNVPTHPFVSYGFLAGVHLWDLVGGKLWHGLSIPSSWAAVIAFPMVGALTWGLEKLLDVDLRLDLLSAELEWWGGRYPNSINDPIKHNTPLPGVLLSAYEPQEFVDDDWRWSVFARKRIASFSIIAQVASDHLRTETQAEMLQDYTQALGTSEDWHFMMKLKYEF